MSPIGPEEIQLFNAAALGEMRTRNLAPHSDDTMPDELIIALSDFEEKIGHEIKSYSSAVEAVNHFRMFLADYHPTQKFQVMHYQITLHVPTKNGASMSLSMVFQPLANPEIATKSAYEDLRRTIGVLRVEGRLDNKNMGKPSTGNWTQNSQGNVYNGQENWPVENILVNGSTIKLCGGRWARYGVTIYREQMRDLEEFLSLDDLQQGDNPPPEGMVATIELKEGKPSRVLRIAAE